MLLALIICHLSVLVAANPFHKYPFVFLLDVGNEELEKTNSEQIRVSVPGGSVALRYPAIGDGDIITHVRVSGIDFGTDLKANILDGGPGYNFVVLVFMGNPGTPYDAVVTVQTVDNNAFKSKNIDTNDSKEVNTYKSEEDENNSAEDLSDTEVSGDTQSGITSNAELMQPSSNVYSYTDNEARDEDENTDDDPLNDDSVEGNEIDTDEAYSEELPSKDDNDDYGINNEKDIHVQYASNMDYEDSRVQVKAIETEDDDNEDVHEEEGFKEESSDYSEESPINTDSNPHNNFNEGDDVYAEEKVQESSRPVYQEDPLDYEDPYAEGPIYDGDEVNRADKYRDSNNNYNLDSDDSYAVAY